METNTTPGANATARALSELVEYLRNPEANGRRGEREFFDGLANVARWLNGELEWDVEDYDKSGEVLRELARRLEIAATVARSSELTVPEPNEAGTAEWVHEAYGCRYRIQGRRPSIRVIVGWDREFATYFVQVWDVWGGARLREKGNLLLLLGTWHAEVPSVEHLAKAVSLFVDMPMGLAESLNADRDYSKGAKAGRASPLRNTIEVTDLAGAFGFRCRVLVTACVWRQFLATDWAFDLAHEWERLSHLLGIVARAYKGEGDDVYTWFYATGGQGEEEIFPIKALHSVSSDGTSELTVMMSWEGER